MKTLKSLIDQKSPVIKENMLVYKIGSPNSYTLKTATESPEDYTIHPFYPDKPITYFRKVGDKSMQTILINDDKVMINSRGISIKSALLRPELFKPLYGMLAQSIMPTT